MHAIGHFSEKDSTCNSLARLSGVLFGLLLPFCLPGLSCCYTARSLRWCPSWLAMNFERATPHNGLHQSTLSWIFPQISRLIDVFCRTQADLIARLCDDAKKEAKIENGLEDISRRDVHGQSLLLKVCHHCHLAVVVKTVLGSHFAS